MIFAGFSAAFEALFEAVQSVFSFASVSKEHQSESEVIKTKNDTEKAVKYALKALNIGYKYIFVMSSPDKKNFLKYYTKFLNLK